jgi:hypothetical protein
MSQDVELTGTVENSTGVLTFSPKLFSRWAGDVSVADSISAGSMVGRMRVQGVNTELLYGDPDDTQVVVKGLKLLDDGRLRVSVVVREKYVFYDMVEWHSRGLIRFDPVFEGSVDESGIVGIGAKLKGFDLTFLVDGKHDSTPSQLPIKYTPKGIRPTNRIPGATAYAVGIEHRRDSIGISDGLWGTLQEALEVVPEWGDSAEVVLVGMRSDVDGQLKSSEILYRWKNNGWTRA